jgi:hypothetical protein
LSFLGLALPSAVGVYAIPEFEQVYLSLGIEASKEVSLFFNYHYFFLLLAVVPLYHSVRIYKATDITPNYSLISGGSSIALTILGLYLFFNMFSAIYEAILNA